MTRRLVRRGVEVIDAHHREQAADAVEVAGLLLDQAFALATGAPCILGGDVGNPHHGAESPFAAIPTDECAQDRFHVDGIGLLATGAAIDLQRARIDDMALGAGGNEPPVQSEAFVAGFVARAYAGRRPTRLGDQRQQPIDIPRGKLMPRWPLRA